VVAVIGRDDELSTLTDFVRRLPASPAAILVEGEAGIGKTTLCSAEKHAPGSGLGAI